jgi:PEGA domain
MLNGAWRGRTPLALDKLAFGNYVVRVVSPGYDVAQEKITLSSAVASGNISVRLQRQRTAAATKPALPREQAPPARSTTPSAAPSTPARPTSPLTGSVYVDSRPRGAKVFIDGKEIGNTPIQIPEVRIGSHVIRLQLADHRIWSNSVSVSAGKESRVSGSLEPIVVK